MSSSPEGALLGRGGDAAEPGVVGLGHALSCSSTGWGRYLAMNAAFEPEWRVTSTAQVVATGQYVGRRRGRTCVAHFVYFL